MATFEDIHGQALKNHNSKVEIFVKEFSRIMKSKGWAKDSSRQSALYHHCFWSDGKIPARYVAGPRARNITISGWHGSGTRGTCRHFGDSKSFLYLYDSERKDHKAVVESELGLGGDLTVKQILEAQDRAMNAALEYARKL